jgi:uncharacterized protein involved in response to NO
VPPVAVFAATALALGVTAGAGLGLALLLARTIGLSLGDASWLALVQVHGGVQLFGFAGLIVMGVGLHLLPRLRGARPPRPAIHYVIYTLAVAGVILRAAAQPVAALPGREIVLAIGALCGVAAALLFAVTALRVLASGENPHRPDELVIAAGVVALPLAAGLAAAGSIDGWPLVIAQDADDRATWVMLLTCLGTLIVGVWSRLAPAFVAARPYDPRLLRAGTILWLLGSVGIATAIPLAAAVIAAGAVVLMITLGVWGPTIARQPLRGHARLTQLALRSAFSWAVVGGLVLLAADLRLLPGTTILTDSAARHAFGLGFVTLAIYGVAGRALPSFLRRDLSSARLHFGAVIATDLAVGMRVVPQVLDLGGIWNPIVALSGVLAYAGMLAFAVNLVRTLRGPRREAPPAGVMVPARITLG